MIREKLFILKMASASGNKTDDSNDYLHHGRCLKKEV